MTPGRPIAIGVGAVVGAVAVGLLVASVFFGGDGREEVSTGASSTTTSSTPPSTAVEESTTTTFDLLPEPTTSTVARPTTTTTAAPAPVVPSSGAVLKAPSGSSGAKRTMTGEECSTLASSGWSAECGFARVKGGDRLVWLVESRTAAVGSSATARRASVLAPDGSQWRVALTAADEDGTRWKSVAVRVVDVSSDGGDELVFGFRTASGSLGLDVVEGPAPGSVTAHVDLRDGSARVSTGQLDTWAYVSGSGATARYQHDLIRWQDGAWRVVSRTQTAARDVPPSQF